MAVAEAQSAYSPEKDARPVNLARSSSRGVSRSYLARLRRRTNELELSRRDRRAYQEDTRISQERAPLTPEFALVSGLFGIQRPDALIINTPPF